MDGRALVEQRLAPAKTVQVEQAIFTSVHSPMERGYRIVAASSGLSADEKIEIVRCAPSHGNLCDPSPTAVGLASFELRSGRRCVFLSRNAGIEHTARGGYRVHTHVLVLDQPAFRRFYCHPLSVQAAALRAIGAEPQPAPPTRLRPFLLRAETDENIRQASDATPATMDVDRLIHILSAVLGERCILVVGTPTPQRILHWVLEATPLAIRQRLSLSYGLKFSPSRRFQLVFAEASDSETQRIIRDHSTERFDWEAAPTRTSSPFEAWLGFVRERWQSGRRNDIQCLAAQLTQESAPRTLEQIVTLHSDIGRLKQADTMLLDQLTKRYSRSTPVSETHARLLGEFREAAELRREMLTRAEQECSTEADPPPIGHA
jgi:hypothetical protein